MGSIFQKKANDQDKLYIKRGEVPMQGKAILFNTQKIVLPMLVTKGG